jgi:hypothetical protein
MATTRLRKAFRYPEEDDSEGPAEGVDEEGTNTLPFPQIALCSNS